MRKSYLLITAIVLALIYSTSSKSSAQMLPACNNGSFPTVVCTCGGQGNNHNCLGSDIIYPGQVITHTAMCPGFGTAIAGGYVIFDADSDGNDEGIPEGTDFTIPQNNFVFTTPLILRNAGIAPTNATALILLRNQIPTGWSVTLDNLSNTSIGEATCVSCCGNRFN